MLKKIQKTWFKLLTLNSGYDRIYKRVENTRETRSLKTEHIQERTTTKNQFFWKQEQTNNEL